MTDWFEWKGVRCTNYGIHVVQQPEIIRPSERATFTSVPGRSGTLTMLEADDVYDDFILSVECFISDLSNLAAIFGWLRGNGTVTFANRQGGFYYARIVNQISFEQVLRGNPHRTFAINFRCQPFFYLKNVSDITLTTGSYQFITNPGNIFSEPVLQITLSGNAYITIGATYFELMETYGMVTVDTPLKETYFDFASHNTSMRGEYPRFLPGSNIVGWSGNVSRIVITPNWRML